MFGLFSTEEKKMRTNASNWLELADKIFNYRHDILPDADRASLRQEIEKVRDLLRKKADAAKLKLGIESLEPVLRKTGGRYYPRSTVQDWVEFFLVGAIVILGIRAYFAQPFKIPTNSMWPSYYGMTPEVFKKPADEPNLLGQAARFAAFGATRETLVAPSSGQLSAIVRFDGSLAPSGKVAGKKFLVLPAEEKEYTFSLGQAEVKIAVPVDFDFDWAFREQFGLTKAQMIELFKKSPNKRGGDHARVTFDRPIERGEKIFSFDILSGDLLFVDRFSCHFFKPKVGQGFVFRTGNIPLIGKDDYYIKRLVGVPGDKLEIREPVLLRNDAPITGADGFDHNNKRDGKYAGYVNEMPFMSGSNLAKGQTFTLPENKYFAMGDNSNHSFDSRYWGTVDAKDVVGRPLIIYYPFTRRWGPAN